MQLQKLKRSVSYWQPWKDVLILKHQINETALKDKGERIVKIFFNEVHPRILAMFTDVDAFDQVACPKLSIDWDTLLRNQYCRRMEQWLSREMTCS
ncbi:hypothetical protein METBIDRAFT_228389 [Metschnikowia bicuspidata var. bicuspidata NRRL YB-4993]|uniref:Uncharacterized protein n=1 Tax=Metschnikowia bicuspidata var. bicuspidata NRRL YB-4993 TaxID=869754 RepID=A0A1A0HGT1_9ASCO|nr:hypothetical protein METBIDRAFT_228389 [Metschnikowia bicuspidata var. bicuspidata NRRL YB-4993]OBA23200.1 hypothetical protein METBIDRAFT_228389 [Metschnikowia bicuspidata var. bicuspidata NRRL YB-4993]